VHAVDAVAAMDVAGEILAEPLVPQRGGHVLIARQQPEALLRLEDRRLVAQPMVEWIGVGDEGRIEGIERQRLIGQRRRGHVVHGSSYHEGPCRANERAPSIVTMFALTQGLRRAVQIKPNGPATAFASRRRTWQQTA